MSAQVQKRVNGRWGEETRATIDKKRELGPADVAIAVAVQCVHVLGRCLRGAQASFLEP